MLSSMIKVKILITLSSDVIFYPIKVNRPTTNTRLNYGLKEVLMLGRIHKKGGGSQHCVGFDIGANGAEGGSGCYRTGCVTLITFKWEG